VKSKRPTCPPAERGEDGQAARVVGGLRLVVGDVQVLAVRADRKSGRKVVVRQAHDDAGRAADRHHAKRATGGVELQYRDSVVVSLGGIERIGAVLIERRGKCKAIEEPVPTGDVCSAEADLRNELAGCGADHRQILPVAEIGRDGEFAVGTGDEVGRVAAEIGGEVVVGDRARQRPRQGSHRRQSDLLTVDQRVLRRHGDG